MKLRASTKIAVGFVLLAVGLYFGYGFVSGLMIDGKSFPPIEPGRVNIVGVDTRAGYYVVVANQVAQLVRGDSAEFTAPGDRTESSLDAEKKRIPIREMLRSLQGDEKALGRFIMVMNGIYDADLPPYPVVWRAEELKKALDGDEALVKKLERDINVRLDGTPPPYARHEALENGIVIDIPVEVTIRSKGAVRTLTGRVQAPYRARFARDVHERYKTKEATPAMIAGYYAAEAELLAKSPSNREDVRKSLLARIDAGHAKRLAEVPEGILNSIEVVVNDSLIESASYREERPTDGKPVYYVTLKLSDEGRQRLWKFSRGREGSQILLVWDGVAVAAPRINHQLAQSEVTITQLRDETLARDTCEAINELARKRNG